MIPFNSPLCLRESLQCVEDVMMNLHKISGDGKYTALCSEWMEQKFRAKKVLLTTSCTAALEMSAILLNIQPGDEVIMPSYTFVSTSNAYVLRGAKIVFVDVRSDTMNIDETLIEKAITNKTKAIVVVHYAGVSCEMNKIMEIAKKHGISVVEDAAQGVMATYQDCYLGTIADLGCYSFHDTKNYTMGEGGALVINDEKYVEQAEILREKGTDRSKFFRGEVDKYSWVDLGSSYLPSEINVAYLYPQLLIADQINDRRREIWQEYYQAFTELQEKGYIELPTIPKGCVHNAHMFWIKLRDLEERTRFIDYMRNKNSIGCVFHFVPLHTAVAGKKYGKFFGQDIYTTKESDRLVRFPMFYDLKEEQVEEVINKTLTFFKEQE